MNGGEKSCNNCGQEVLGNYCSNCGQRTKVGQLTFSDLGEDLSQSLFSLEAPIWLTLKMLFTTPHKLFHQYLNGHRKKFYKPIAFFILATAILIVVRPLIGFEDNMDSFIRTNGSNKLISDARHFFLVHINKFLFLFALGLGVSLKLFFFRKNHFVEFCVIGFYIAGIYTIFTIFSSILTVILNEQIQQLIMLIMLIYFLYTCARYFSGNKFLIILKAFFAYVLAMIIYAMGGFGLSYLFVSLQ